MFDPYRRDRRGGGCVPQINHQPIAVLRIGRRQETLGLNRMRELKHDAQVPRTGLCDAHALDDAGRAVRGAHAVAQAPGGDVEHDPVRVLQRLQAVLRLA